MATRIASSSPEARSVQDLRTGVSLKPLPRAGSSALHFPVGSDVDNLSSPSQVFRLDSAPVTGSNADHFRRPASPISARAAPAMTRELPGATLTNLAEMERRIEQRLALACLDHLQRFDDMEIRVETRLAELEQRMTEQGSALIDTARIIETSERLRDELFRNMEQVIDTIEKRFASRQVASKSMEHIQQQIVSLQKSEHDMVHINQSSGILNDIFGQIRSFQSSIETLNSDIEVDAGLVRMLHTRVDWLESEFHAINDRVHSSSLTSARSAEPLSERQTRLGEELDRKREIDELSERQTRLEKGQKKLADATWELQEQMGAFDWKLGHGDAPAYPWGRPSQLAKMGLPSQLANTFHTLSQ